MSLPVSNPTTKKGILQRIELELGWDYGHITDNATRLLTWIAEMNITHDDLLALLFKAGGTWQFDDSNHPKYPTIESDLVSGQRDYAFTTDEQGNLILDIYRVLIKNPDGVYVDIEAVDQQTKAVAGSRSGNALGFVDGQNITGTPTRYDKTANGILLDPIPNYNFRIGTELERGVKILINREGTYFKTTDTTKMPGVAGLLHEYYVVSPAERYASRKSLTVAKSLLRRKLELEQKARDHYGFRERDVKKRLIPNVESTR